MHEESDLEFAQFCENESRKLIKAGKSEDSLTPLGASVAYFRTMPYPCTPEREAEIDQLHRADLSRARAEHRQMRVAFAQACLEGKHGDEAVSIAQSCLAGAPAEECGIEYLWDCWRRVAWMKARARGESVPEKLKPLEECLAVYRARKLSDERWADNDPGVVSVPPMDPELTKRRHGSPYNPPDPRLPPEPDLDDDNTFSDIL